MNKQHILAALLMICCVQASAELPLDFGIYSFFGSFKQAKDGFIYFSSPKKSRLSMELRIAGFPLSQVKNPSLGIRFYNPKRVTSLTSNNTIVFIAFEDGGERDLNSNLGREPKLLSKEDCAKGSDYLAKIRRSE